jgi:shikimate kinase
MSKEGQIAAAGIARKAAEPSPGTVEEAIRERLGHRSVVLVGLMGAGKSTVGRRLATRLDLAFKDADVEIEAAAGMSVSDIFAIHGEPYFREGEARVIGRLLQEGPIVLATGGGAFMNADTRTRIAAAGVSVWLKADFDVLMRRVRKRSNRPLLKTTDPEARMRELIDLRYPVYGLADLTVQSREVPHDRVVEDAVNALDAYLSLETGHPAP